MSSKKEDKLTLQRTNWESDLKIVENVTVIVPIKLLIVCNHISNRVGHNEFSIVTNIKERELDRVEIEEDYYIPKQIITGGSIDYEPDNYDHNVVIHRHPDRCNDFSPTDREFINQNFELSLLFTKRDGFVNGIYNLRHEDAIIPLPVEIIIDYGIGKVDMTNLTEGYQFEIEKMREERMKDEKQTKGDRSKPEGIEEDLNMAISELNDRLDFLESEMYQLSGPFAH